MLFRSMVMRLLPLTVKILSIEMSLKRGLNKGTLGTLSETLNDNEPDADNVISVQNITVTIPAYAPPALSFSANTWENIVDPSHIEISFVSTWREGMNLCKGLTFANKVEVKRILTLCALKENKHFVISRSTNKKLCAECVNELSKWYVYAVMKPNLHGLWMVIVYVGPHIYRLECEMMVE